MHEVLVNRFGGLSLPRKSVVRLTDRPDMTLDVHCGRKTTMQQHATESHKSYSPFKKRKKHLEVCIPYTFVDLLEFKDGRVKEMIEVSIYLRLTGYVMNNIKRYLIRGEIY